MQISTVWLGMRQWAMTRWGESFDLFWRQEMAKLPFFRMLLTLIVSVDVVLILIHILHKTTGLFVRQFFSIEFEDGYGEFYQAIKQGWVSLILLRLAVQHRYRHFLVWSALFLYVMLDDFFAIHETLGYQLVTMIDLPPMLGLRNVDFGEIFVLAVVALLFLPLLVTTYRSGGATLQRDARTLLGLLVLLALFATGADLLHSLLSTTALSDAIGTIEDGGEMVITSVILWFTLLLLARNALPTPIPRLKRMIE